MHSAWQKGWSRQEETIKQGIWKTCSAWRRVVPTRQFGELFRLATWELRQAISRAEWVALEDFTQL